MIITIIAGVLAGLYLSFWRSMLLFVLFPVGISIRYYFQLDLWRRLGLMPPDFWIMLASSSAVSFVVFMIFYGVGRGIVRLTRKKSAD